MYPQLSLQRQAGTARCVQGLKSAEGIGGVADRGSHWGLWFLLGHCKSVPVKCLTMVG